MVPRDDDRPAEFARRNQAADRPPDLRWLSVGEPAAPRVAAFPREVFLREADPPGERLVVRELPQDDAVRLDDVVRVAGDGDQSERPAAFREEGTDEKRHESLKSERILDAGFLRLSADVVQIGRAHV